MYMCVCECVGKYFMFLWIYKISFMSLAVAFPVYRLAQQRLPQNFFHLRLLPAMSSDSLSPVTCPHSSTAMAWHPQQVWGNFVKLFVWNSQFLLMKFLAQAALAGLRWPRDLREQVFMELNT